MYFVQNVKHLLDERRWNNAELSRATNISPAQIGRYLSGTHQPKVETVIAVAKVLDVNIDDLLLKDLSQESGRPFGAEGEDKATMDETLTRMNELLEQRLRLVEQALKERDPDLARKYGIE
ncbi:helix-turn-helix domain-containing protein [Lewinella sp. W8]|uniref:helix-turn-helix domain-containing protein n=1 Tax=Lewinella sp. W8 TaxID=2528208 RepID=UPI0010683933|nr:helix-turn-helix transcriptional regulator [Lewinella sp. W8]MTB49800.1 helix-turn-helix domain-containing protein [Lewinella sp. W8]